MAKEPAITSIIPRKLNIFAIAHPIKSPGTAALVKNGSTHSASDMRSSIIPSWPKLSGATAIVSTKYNAAITPASARNLICFFTSAYHNIGNATRHNYYLAHSFACKKRSEIGVTHYLVFNILF